MRFLCLSYHSTHFHGSKCFLTLCEIFVSDGIFLKLAGWKGVKPDDVRSNGRMMIDAFRNAGYDYAAIRGSDFSFGTHKCQDMTTSLNDGAAIFDKENMDKYEWPGRAGKRDRSGRF